MNTKLSFLSFLVLLSATNFAQINFEHDSWDKIKAKAKAEHKLIFMDAYTSWCGPCKWMSSVVFTNDTVGKFYNSTFINAKFDMEKGEGVEIAKLYGVKVYPTLLYINGDGEIMHRAVGGRPATQFIALGKDAQNPEKCFATLNKKYLSGNYDYKFITSYLSMLDDIYFAP
jgi:thiol-disulfide isomerase/thioredoxin